MIAYYDTGPFFDYMIQVGHAGTLLRTGPRRDRDLETLCRDAEECVKKTQQRHQALTSCHTLYEAENAVFSALKGVAKGKPRSDEMVILSARPVILQSIKIAELYRIGIKDLTKDLLRTAAETPSFSDQGVRLGDTLHMTTAMKENADLIISGDDHILSYDGKLRNVGGAAIRCLDTHEAKRTL